MPSAKGVSLNLAGRERRAALVSQTSEYALRAMASIAALPRGESLTAPAIASQTGVPVHYLSKVLRKLVQSGLLIGQKGHHGGFQLARAPERIRFADILAAMGEGLEKDYCAFGWARCDPKNPCPLHPAYSRLNESFSEWLSSTTLADASWEQ